MNRFYAFGTVAVGTLLVAWSVSAFAQAANPAMPAMPSLAVPMLGPAGMGYGFPPVFDHRGVGPFGQSTRSPAEACMQAIAFKAGIHAYVKARLNLTPQQLQAAQAVDAVAAEFQREGRERCAKLPTTLTPPDMATRMVFMEERLTARLRQMKRMGPAMLKLYESLSEDQRKTLDQIASSRRFL